MSSDEHEDDADAFSQLLGRQATREERERLHRIKSTLKLPDNDALWSVLVALEYYDTLYREYPRMIAAALRECLHEQVLSAVPRTEANGSRTTKRFSRRTVLMDPPIETVRVVNTPSRRQRASTAGRDAGPRERNRRHGLERRFLELTVEIGFARAADLLAKLKALPRTLTRRA